MITMVIHKDQYTCNYLELLGVLLGGAVEASFSQLCSWDLEVPCERLVLIEHTKSGTSPFFTQEKGV